jgi:hypothetical protein
MRRISLFLIFFLIPGAFAATPVKPKRRHLDTRTQAHHSGAERE